MATKQEGKGKKSAASEDEKQPKSSQKATKQEETSAKQSKQNESDAKAEHKSDFDEGQELDALLELLQDDDLISVDLDEAVNVIDEWYDILHSSKEPELKEIGNNLKQLKKHLTNKKADVTDITESLTQLGDQVNTYADDAERGYKTKLHKVGKALSKAGESIEQDIEADVDEGEEE